jgi:hypothetical protein
MRAPALGADMTADKPWLVVKLLEMQSASLAVPCLALPFAACLDAM